MTRTPPSAAATVAVGRSPRSTPGTSCPTHFCGQISPEAEFETEEEYEAVAAESVLVWAVKHGRAEFTREEAARRAADALKNAPPPPPPSAPLADDDIPF